MAVSLAFGVLFATVITLFLVPIAYAILDDLQRLPRLVASLGAAPAHRAVTVFERRGGPNLAPVPDYAAGRRAESPTRSPTRFSRHATQ